MKSAKQRLASDVILKQESFDSCTIVKKETPP